MHGESVTSNCWCVPLSRYYYRGCGLPYGRHFHTGNGIFSSWFTELWVTVHWITIKTLRIQYENAWRTRSATSLFYMYHRVVLILGRLFSRLSISWYPRNQVVNLTSSYQIYRGTLQSDRRVYVGCKAQTILPVFDAKSQYTSNDGIVSSTGPAGSILNIPLGTVGYWISIS